MFTYNIGNYIINILYHTVCYIYNIYYMYNIIRAIRKYRLLHIYNSLYTVMVLRGSFKMCNTIKNM